MMASIFDNTFTFILFVILLINTATLNCRCILFLGASSLSSNLCIKEPVLPWLPILFDAMDFLIYFIIRWWFVWRILFSFFFVAIVTIRSCFNAVIIYFFSSFCCNEHSGVVLFLLHLLVIVLCLLTILIKINFHIESWLALSSLFLLDSWFCCWPLWW